MGNREGRQCLLFRISNMSKGKRIDKNDRRLVVTNTRVINEIFMKKHFYTFLLLAAPLLVHAQPIHPFTPPEYAPAKAVLIEWDFNPNTWSLYSPLIAACREAAETICVVRDMGEENIMRSRLTQDGVSLDNVSFVHVPCERMWIRDHGPFAIMTDEGMAFMEFDDHANSGMDEYLPTNLANLWGLSVFELPWVFDGGNLMVDGHGTLFCTNGLYSRNPNMSKQQIHADLEHYMGIKQVVALKSQHNDYWKHIDMQVKLLDDSTLVVSSVALGSSANHDSLEHNYNLLAALESPNGQPYRIARLPHADNWKTYANALLLNNHLLVPTYSHPNDSLALATYASLLPNHTVVGIDCNKIIGWDGALHCITMQLFDDAQVSRVKNISTRHDGFSVWPNPVPTGGTLWLRFADEWHDATWVQVLDVQGRVLHSQWLTPSDAAAVRLPVHLTPGVYWLQASGEQRMGVRRFVVR